MSSPTLPTPSAEELSELLLCARYGDDSDLDDMKAFVATYGASWLADARDDRGNTCLHMAGGNGHAEIVSYLLPLLPLSALSTPNTALSTPLHWTSLNYHLSCLRLLCPLLSAPAFTLRNGHQKTAVEEAEEACEAFVVDEGEEGSERGKERVRREVVVGYLLGVMGLGVKKMSGKDEEVMDGLAKSAEGVKLGEEEEVVMKSEDVL